MKPNNFKALEEQQEAQFRGKSEDIQKNVTHSVGIVKLIGNIFELYLPRVFSVFTYMSGGSSTDLEDHKNDQPKYPNT